MKIPDIIIRLFPTIRALLSFEFIFWQLVFIACAIFGDKMLFRQRVMIVAMSLIIWMVYKLADPFKQMRLESFDDDCQPTPAAIKNLSALFAACFIEGIFIFFVEI